MSNYLADAQINSNYTVEFWNKYLLGMIVLEQSNFVFSQLGKKVSIPKNAGTKTISLRRYNSLPVSGDLTSEKLSEGVAPTPLKIEAQKVQGTINQYGAYIKITDEVDDIHDDDIKSVYMPELARHASEVIERNVIASFADASEWFVASQTSIDSLTSSTTHVLTLKEVRKAILSMKNYRRSGHVKFGGKPVLVVHINVMQDLLDDTDLKDKMLVPGNDNSPIKSGSLEQYKVYGFYLIETLIAEVQENGASPTPNNVYTSYLLGRDPYIVISLGGSNVKWYNTGFKAEKTDPLGQWATFGYKLWTGAKVIDPLAITKIYSVSAYDVALASDFSDDPLGRNALQIVLDEVTIDATLAQTAQNEEDTLTAVVKDENDKTVTSMEDGYELVWTSSDVKVATVTKTDVFTAKVKAIKATSGTATITVQLVRKTASGNVVLSTDTCAYTLTIQ
jgi:N4-gp56 family major capsid protein